MKSPLTPTEIEPATFRFVAQHLNHCATAVRLVRSYFIIYSQVYDIAGGKEAEGVTEHGVEENIWT